MNYLSTSWPLWSVLLALLVLLHLVARQRRAAARAQAQRVAQAVTDRTTELRELAHHLQLARDDERARLARDLHDELGSLLTAAKLDAARIRARLGTEAPEAQERLAHLVSLLDQVITIKRRITEDLMPSALVHLGLIAALEALARDFADASGAEVHCTLVPVALPASVELTVYRLVQEALTNTGKHANARQVWICLAPVDEQAEVSVRDDGSGFDPRTRSGRAHGLLGMQFRVESEGGTLDLRAAPGLGCTVTARMPAGQLRRDAAATATGDAAAGDAANAGSAGRSMATRWPPTGPGSAPLPVGAVLQHATPGADGQAA